MKPRPAPFLLQVGVWIGLAILLLPPSLPLKADTYAGYGPESPGQYPSTNALARPYHVQYCSNLDGFTNLFTLSFPRDFDPRKSYPAWFKFKPYFGSGMNIKHPNFAYNFCDAHQVIFIGCNDRDIGDAFFGDNTNINPVTAQNLAADTIEVLNQLLYLFKINYVASFGASMGGYSAFRLMTYLPSNYVGVVTPSCPALWFREYVKAGSDLIADAVSRGHFAEAFVLIMHGTADDTVPIEHSRELTALASPKDWWQLVEASGAGHEEFFCIFDYSKPFPDDEQWGKSTLVPDIWDQIGAWETAHPDHVNRRLEPLPGWKPPMNWYFPQAVVQDGVGPTPDTTPPEPVSALIATPGNMSATLQWQASPSADVVGHRIYVDGLLRTNLGNVTGYTVRDLVNGVPYLLGVTALDGATNESTRVEVSVTPVESPPGSLMTNVFQKGVSPDATYNQCLDSIFRQVDGETFAMEALGKAPTMDPRWTNSAGTACIWFDLSSLPDNATVSEARLGIWFQPNEFDGSGSLVLHRLLDPDGTGMWAENNLVDEDAYDTGGASIADNAMGSARFKRVDVPWSGTDGRYYDVINPAAARTYDHTAGTPEWTTFNVTDDLQAFVADSRLNLGWAFHSAADDSLRGELYLSDHPEAAKRPRLEVIYSVDTNAPPHHLPPVANAGLDQTLTDTDGNGWELVTLDGTASMAKEGTIVQYVWTLGDQLLGSTAVIQTNLPVGTNVVTFAVWDNYNASNTDTVTITILPAPSQPSGLPLTSRTIPPLSAILAASEVLHPGDIPEDTFQPPANAIYVAPAALSGNDANDGTSLSAPFEHLEKAIEYANDHPETPLTIYLRGGVYYYKAESCYWYLEIQRGNLYVTAYGTEPVTIRPFYWPGNPTESGNERVFTIFGPYSNITFANLGFEGWSIIFDFGCPYETAPLRNVTLKNIRARSFTHRLGNPDFQRVFLTTAYLANDIYGPGKVIFDHPDTARFQMENLLLSRITVEDVDLAVNVGDENDANIKGLRISGFDLNNPPPQATGTSASDGLAIVNCYKVLIDDCTIHNTADDGIDCKSYDVSVFNCLVQATIRNAVKLWRNGELINSIIYDCTTINDGALVVDQEGGPFRMVHSAIIKKSDGYAGTLYYDSDDPTHYNDLVGCQFINSIFVDLAHSFFIGTSNFVAHHCLFHDLPDGLFSGRFDLRTVAALNGLTGSSNNIAAPPGLLNPAAGDFRPAFGSACIDAGTTNGVLLPSFDYWGRPRIVGQAPDIGPIEYDARITDSDGDGVMDSDEAIAGTNPLDKQDFLHLDILLAAENPDKCLLSWNSVPTRRYDLLMTTDLLLAWQPLANQTNLVGNGTTLTVTDRPATTPVFYRLTVRNE